MKAMEKLLLVLMLLVVANPTLAAADNIRPLNALRTPIETELNFEGRFVRVITPGSLHHVHHRRLPLVLHLHGAVPFPDIADLELDNSGYRDLPGRFQVIVAAPTATLHPVLSLFHWDITEECCAFPSGTEPDDVGFLNRLLDELIASYPVDPRRVYIYGYSAGAAMAYRLACDSTERFAAIASGGSSGRGFLDYAF
jgi:polyhydroxybutyrate depolymerase